LQDFHDRVLAVKSGVERRPSSGWDFAACIYVMRLDKYNSSKHSPYLKHWQRVCFLILVPSNSSFVSHTEVRVPVKVL
jgi:hypothetical protein